MSFLKRRRFPGRLGLTPFDGSSCYRKTNYSAVHLSKNDVGNMSPIRFCPVCPSYGRNRAAADFLEEDFWGEISSGLPVTLQYHSMR